MACPNGGALEENLDIASISELRSYLTLSTQAVAERRFNSASPLHLKAAELLQEYARKKINGEETIETYNQLPDWAAW